MVAGGQSSNPNSYALSIGGIDYTTWVDVTGTSWSESGTETPSQFECTVASGEVSSKTITAGYDFTGQTVILQDIGNSRKLWSGFVVEQKIVHGAASAVYYTLRGVSWDALLDRYTIPKWRSTLDGTKQTRLILSDRAMVQKLIADYGYSITANNSNVSNTNADMPRLTLTAVTTRDALQAVADAAAWPASPKARRFYVDFDKQLHYFKDTEGTSAPFQIGDRLYNGTYIIPDYIDYGKSITDAAKGVYIKGSNKYGTGLVMNASTQVRPVDRMDLIDVPESDSSRAKADISAAYFNREGAAVIGGVFEITGKDGWRAGQTVHIRDSAFGLDDDFQIREIQATPNLGSGVTTYRIAYGSIPYRLSNMTGRKSRAAAGAGGRTNPGSSATPDPAPNDDPRPPEPGGGGGSGGGGGCFIAGTLISTPDGPRAIESITVGDQVFTHEGVGTVVTLKPHPAHVEPRVAVTLTDGRSFEVTTSHRFLEPRSAAWRNIGRFLPGDYVHDAKSGPVRIASMAWLGDEATDVFNFEVEPQHTYLVDGIVVHNAKTP